MNKAVLVMDDDEDVRLIYEWYLTKLGFTPEFVSDGDEAVKVHAEKHNKDEHYSAVILDINIPGKMGGKGTLKQMLEIEPDILAIVASGADEDPAVDKFTSFGFKARLMKPFRLDELKETFCQLSLL